MVTSFKYSPLPSSFLASLGHVIDEREGTYGRVIHSKKFHSDSEIWSGTVINLKQTNIWRPGKFL